VQHRFGSSAAADELKADPQSVTAMHVCVPMKTTCNSTRLTHRPATSTRLTDRMSVSVVAQIFAYDVEARCRRFHASRI